jgi:predicted dinucleotide-utilizing enzyme
VRLRTTKSPTSLGLQLSERTLLFRGTAAECIQHYPRNINVAVALSLAADREVEVELWADPAVYRNSHEVTVTGEFGEANLASFNLPSPDNPATSYLAALSILTLLKNLGRPLQIGT